MFCPVQPVEPLQGQSCWLVGFPAASPLVTASACTQPSWRPRRRWERLRAHSPLLTAGRWSHSGAWGPWLFCGTCHGNWDTMTIRVSDKLNSFQFKSKHDTRISKISNIWVFLTTGGACRRIHRPPLWSPGHPDGAALASCWGRRRVLRRTHERHAWKRSRRPDGQCHNPVLREEHPGRTRCCRSAFCPQCH